MKSCEICGTTAESIVPPGSNKCIECMSDCEIEQVDLSLVAAEIETELARMEKKVSRSVIIPGDGRDGGVPIGEVAC